jgi:hypothetical protein
MRRAPDQDVAKAISRMLCNIAHNSLIDRDNLAVSHRRICQIHVYQHKAKMIREKLIAVYHREGAFLCRTD